MFQQPASGGGFFESKNALGHLVLITKVHSITQVTDTYGGVARLVDEVVMDLVDLDAIDPQTGQPAHRERVKNQHVGIVNRLTVGKELVLGRIGQVQTANGNTTFVLQPFDEATDAPRAAAWVNAWRAGQVAQPQAPAPAFPAPPAAFPPVPGPQVPVAAPQAVPVAPVAPAVDPALLAAAQAQLQAQAAAQAAAAVPPPPAPAAAVDQAALAALMAQMGGTVVQQ
jgi:hypothetical protein